MLKYCREFILIKSINIEVIKFKVLFKELLSLNFSLNFLVIY